jgi:hypothetical protein
MTQRQPHAESAAGLLSGVLAAAGVPKDHQLILVGPNATKTAIEARIGQLRGKVRKGDALLFFLSVQTILQEGTTLVACWDTIPDLSVETSIPLKTLLVAARKSNSGDVILFFDPTGQWNLDELTDQGRAVGLISHSPNEESEGAAELKSSLWLHLIGEALTRRVEIGCWGFGLQQ